MDSTNFDHAYFRRIIANSSDTVPIPSITQLLTEATHMFYEEFDYYPNVAYCAPGTFTIMGDYMELAGGYIVEAAMPMLTLVLARHHPASKIRVVTSSPEIEDPKRIVFSISRCRRLKKGYPKWADLLKGVANLFLNKATKGFDAVIHSNVPMSRGLGSSAAFLAVFYSLFDSTIYGGSGNEGKLAKGKKCLGIENMFGETKDGLYNNIAVFFADSRQGVVVNSGEVAVEMFNFRDPNILFLLAIPRSNLLKQRTNLLRMRETELKLAAKFLDLDDIKYAKLCHLEVLASMEDPRTEKVVAILREFENDDEYIQEFVEEFFRLPEAEDYQIIEESTVLKGEDAEEERLRLMLGEDGGSIVGMEFGGESDYVVEYKYKKVCDETICLGGLSDLSARSDLTVMSKLYRRVRHIVTENQRIRSFVWHVSKLDYHNAGLEITRSHLSLKADFEVSDPILDRIVQFTAEQENGVYGAKMMRNGGILTLLNRNAAEGLMDSMKNQFGIDFDFYLVFPGRGMSEVKLPLPPTPKSLLSNAYSNVEELMKRAVANFDATYQRMPTHGCFAPAVISVLGSYCSFNHNHSLPMAINMGTVVVGALNGSGKVRAAVTADTTDKLQKVIFPLPSVSPLAPGKTQWANYVKGAVNYFKGFVPGFDCLIETSVPIGGRVYHGASLEIAVYGFLEELTESRAENQNEKASACMRAEQEFTNTVCGIDEFVAAAMGKENMMMAVDCKKCSLMHLPFFDPSYVFVLIQGRSRVINHKPLLYNRLEQCYDVAKALKMSSLRCARLEDLDGLNKVSEEAKKRARHIITEELRVVDGMKALNKFDVETFGRLMVDSHISLRDEFEVSNPETDFMVERCLEVDGVVGARMTGSEYGSSVMCLVKSWVVDDLVDYIRDTCENDFSSYILTPSEGARGLDIKGYVSSLPGPKHTFERVFRP